MLYLKLSICVHKNVFCMFSLEIMQFYFILFFLYFLNEKFQLCTKMRDSKVYTSAYTFFSHSYCLFDLLVNVFND